AGTLRSMKWLLEAAGVPATGVSGALRIHGLMALWLYALRSWEQDDSLDLSGTMAAVDRGLDRAMQAERSLPGRRPDPVIDDTFSDPTRSPEPPPMIGDFPDDGPVVA
ncbi:MAG: TetR family transcriptional regulator, partial [Pseudomonadota bacterium]|nr:TetR family transcriptional regulator [Pseudomonadota bacterium]